MLFSQVAGHNEIKQRLVEQVKQGRISHAQLFFGPEGSGKMALALAYAQYLNCLHPKENESCGECKSCRKFDKLIHPDLHFVFPVAKVGKINKPVSNDFIVPWREYLLDNKAYVSFSSWLEKLGVENQQAGIFAQESQEIIRIVNYKTFEARYKVIIIYLPEKMNLSASNKLLKAIEEPPPNTLFLLIANDVDYVLPTILSRTQMIKVPKLSTDDIIKILKKNYVGIDQIILNDAVTVSNGNLLYAKQIVESGISEEQNLNTILYDYFVKFMRLAYALNFVEIFHFVDELASLGREKQKQFLEYCLRMFRENFVLTAKVKKVSYLTTKEKDFSAKFHTFINEKNIELLYNEFNKAIYEITRNASAKILFADLIIKTSKLLKIK